MGFEHNGHEYARFGELVIRRQDATQPWEDATDEAPPEFFEEEIIQRAVTSGRLEPKRRIAADGQFFSGRSSGVLVQSNPTIDETAARLGMSPMRLREELNSHLPTATERIPDEEFDRRMADLGLDPAEARNRFRGTFQDPQPGRPVGL